MLTQHSAGDDKAQETEEQMLQWMWADAGISSKLAEKNPFRWSSKMAPGAIEEDLLRQTAERPVSLRVCSQGFQVGNSLWFGSG